MAARRKPPRFRAREADPRLAEEVARLRAENEQLRRQQAYSDLSDAASSFNSRTSLSRSYDQELADLRGSNERLLAEHYQSPHRFQIIASHLPDKDPGACQRRYDLLEADVRSIQAGRVPLPNYSAVEAKVAAAGGGNGRGRVAGAGRRAPSPACAPRRALRRGRAGGRRRVAVHAVQAGVQDGLAHAAGVPKQLRLRLRPGHPLQYLGERVPLRAGGQVGAPVDGHERVHGRVLQLSLEPPPLRALRGPGGLQRPPPGHGHLAPRPRGLRSRSPPPLPPPAAAAARCRRALAWAVSVWGIRTQCNTPQEIIDAIAVFVVWDPQLVVGCPR